MARNFKNISQGMRLIPHDGTTEASVGGDLDVASNGKLNFYNASQSSTSPVVTESHSATLINKSLDGNNNTFSNIPSSALGTIARNKIAAGTANSVVVNDGSGLLSSTTTLTVPLGGTGAATLTGYVKGSGTSALTASATVPRADVANGTANHVVINSGVGALSSEATLAKSRGGTGQDNSSVTFPASGEIVTTDATQTLTNKTITLDSGRSAVSTDDDGNLTAIGTLPAVYGGTGINLYDDGDLLYASGETTLAKLNIGSNGKFLSIVSGFPAWSNVPTGLAWNSQTFTSNGTWTSGANTTYAFVVGHGGGGGGGGGSQNLTNPADGGMGGGGAASVSVPVSVTPNTPYAVTIGAGGSGGAGGSSIGSGAQGGTSSLGSLVSFYGASGGVGGVPPGASPSAVYYGRLYGRSTGGGGDGGWGGAIASSFPALQGNVSVFATGGAGGANGAGNTGGGGGGGGDGAGGAGGAGASTGGTGSAGTDGGGGGGGGGSTLGGASGGVGGGGKIVIYWLD